MATSGFIIDAPNVLILGTNSNAQILTATKGEVKVAGESIEITGGWSAYNLAKINTKKKIDISLTDSQIKMKTLALQNGTTVQTGAKEQFKFGDGYVVATNKIEIPHAVVTGSVIIDGFTEATGTLATKQFKVTVASEVTTIEFFTDVADGTVINPVYRVSVTDAESVSALANAFAGTAQFVMEYPMYGKDSAGNDILSGTMQWVIFKANLETNVGVSGGYKSASTFDLTASGLDPQRADKKIFEINFFPVAV